MMTLRTLCNAVFLLGLSVSAVAEMSLVADKSAVQFISVKNAAVAEVHHFRTLNGRVADDGKTQLTIPLVDVETMIPIRNERMQKLFFDVDRFPSATITTNVDMAAIDALKSGDYKQIALDLSLDLHGNRQVIRAPVTVARLGNEIHVTTDKPLVLNVADFQLTDGVERLREIAGLKNISTAVPVTATLVFTR